MAGVQRPFLSASIDQIEEALENAIAAGDTGTVSRISHELTFRRVPRARDLVKRIESGGSGATRPASTPPKRSASGPRQTKSASQGTAQAGTKLKHKPTGEQVAALDGFGTGGSLRINAFAGSGKTSTLQMLAHSSERRGQYIAFNRSIVTDAKTKFPQTVNCSTTHGLAYRAIAGGFGGNNEKMTGRISAQKLADVLELKKGWRVDERHSLPPRSVAFLILDTIRSFGQSGDEVILDRHVPRHGSLLTASEETVSRVNEHARRGAEHVWSRMCDADDPLPLGHDGYLKLWALSRPRIAAEFILLDEAQDTNPVVLEVLKRQDAQLVYVGDQYQQIYEWRGAVNAMAAMETDHAVTLTKSFRFGPEIAAAASLVLQKLGESKALTGNSAIRSSIAHCTPDTILARTNANVMASLLGALDDGRKPHLVGGTTELMAMLKGVQDLKAGSPSVVPDFFGFANWREVVEFADSQEGAHLLTFVNLVEARGEKQLMWALNRTVDEAEADLVLSTAHKAKGREWANVQLMDDFLPTRPTSKGATAADAKKADDEFAAELRLFYVAMTRAREIIDIPSTILEKIGMKSTAPVQAEAGTTAAPAARPRPKSPTPEAPAWVRPADWQKTPNSKTSPVSTEPATRQAPPLPTPSPPRQKKSFFDWLFGTR
ncbi:MAG: hypothetical protein EON86_00515 [Brevundimonas sp.]|nr:MAG: hypothetical protein EON86_00515 [Brevundimonas sp.]